MANYDIGIIGGGQLGRMLIQKGLDYGLRFKVLDSQPDCPCARAAARCVTGRPTDDHDVQDFARDCEAIVLEIEHVNVDALSAIEATGKGVYPQASALRIIQDKYRQKCFFREHGIPTAAFKKVDSINEQRVESLFDDEATVVLKLRRTGYDGRGVTFWQRGTPVPTTFLQASCVVEERIPVAQELAVIAGRDQQGAVALFPPAALFFHKEAPILSHLVSPTVLAQGIAEQAQEIAHTLITTLPLCGLLAVEFLLTQDHQLLVNEISPRLHNSGHHTIEANNTSQYEQLIRIVGGYPMGCTEATQQACMLNILGEKGYQGAPIYRGMEQVLALPHTYVHLYDKPLTRPLRKMGHITLLAADTDTLSERMHYIRENFQVIA